jgi:hypothetical protein
MGNLITIFVSFVNGESTPFSGPCQRFYNEQLSLIMCVRIVLQNESRIFKLRLLVKCILLLLKLFKASLSTFLALGETSSQDLMNSSHQTLKNENKQVIPDQLMSSL